MSEQVKNSDVDCEKRFKYNWYACVFKTHNTHKFIAAMTNTGNSSRVIGVNN